MKNSNLNLEEMINMVEKLCKKGQAYRRKRMAAGEKSSAYLSGRAVKVCKGQMKGEGEELDEMDLQYRKGYKDLTGLYKKIVDTNDIEEKKKLSHVFIDSLKRISREKRYQHKQAIQGGNISRINDLITNLYMRDNKMTSEDTIDEADMSIQEVLDMEVIDENITEAKYKGKTVTLNKPMRGDVKKFKVYVNTGKKNADGSIKVKKVNFGHGGTSAKKLGQKTMKIRKSNPKRRAAFRARHRCDNPGPKTMARYWSCKKW